ncbi:MAG TPA: hypothetical protein IAC93_03850 [Candidatus Limisoma gallistercoris]|nr:hypothetical protein [Candidatus Limisoma gallistercoris]
MYRINKRQNEEIHIPVAAPVPPDSADAARLERKAFWRASAETAGFNNKQRLSISLANRFYRLYTWKGYDTYSF